MLKFLFAILAIVALPLSVPAAENYIADPDRTRARFSIHYLGFMTVQGQFDKTYGTVTLDRASNTGSLAFTIETASINTGIDARDDYLKSPDFFNAVKFPAISYKSSAIRFKGDVPVSVEGSLTISGFTRPVILQIDVFKCDSAPTEAKKINQKCYADASARIMRSDFGMSRLLPVVSDDVKLVFWFETV